MDGVRRAGTDDHVADTEQGQRHVRQPLLRADRGHDLGVGVDLHAEPAPVPTRHRQAELGQTLGERVAVIRPFARRLDQLLDDVRRRGPVGVSHAEIDDVLPRDAGPVLEVHDFGKNIRGKALDPRKFHISSDS